MLFTIRSTLTKIAQRSPSPNESLDFIMAKRTLRNDVCFVFPYDRDVTERDSRRLERGRKAGIERDARRCAFRT